MPPAVVCVSGADGNEVGPDELFTETATLLEVPVCDLPPVAFDFSVPVVAGEVCLEGTEAVASRG